MRKSCAVSLVSFFPHSALWAAWLMIAVAVVGCSGPVHELTPVNGRVTYNGKPLEFGCVTLQPEKGQWSRGVIQPDGSFEMETPGEGDGAAVGTNRVRITCFEAQNPADRAREGMAGISLGKSLIPQKYLQYETSGLTVEVRRGTNDPLVFELVD